MDYYHAIFEEQCYYHVYNQGNNKENLFYNDGNYIYFLEKWNKYFSNYLDVWSYCLMPNHFHFLVEVKEKNISTGNLRKSPDEETFGNLSRPAGVGISEVCAGNKKTSEIPSHIPSEISEGSEEKIFEGSGSKPDINKILLNQFKNFFISYAKSINKQQNRTGSLFQKKFKRIHVDSDDYITTLIHYIHHNPIHHGFVKHYSKWKYSSYNAILSNLKTKVKRDIILEWFNSREEFIKFHQQEINYKAIEKYIVEEEIELIKG